MGLRHCILSTETRDQSAWRDMEMRTKPYFPSVTGVARLTDASSGPARLCVASNVAPEQVACSFSNCVSRLASTRAFSLTCE